VAFLLLLDKNIAFASTLGGQETRPRVGQRDPAPIEAEWAAAPPRAIQDDSDLIAKSQNTTQPHPGNRGMRVGRELTEMDSQDPC